MFDKIKKNPILQIVLIALAIIIVVAVFTPRGNSLTAGLRVNANVGRLQGGFNLEAMTNAGDLVLYHADWCGHCQRLMPEWDRFQANYNGPVNVKKVNADHEKELVQKHGVQGFPTIRHYPNGIADAGNHQAYEGPRTADGLNQFVNQVHGVQNQMPDRAQDVNQSN